MKDEIPNNLRVLGIAPSTRGFGYAILEPEGALADWGVRSVKGDKNAESLKGIRNLVNLYHPGVIVLQDTKHGRSSRIRRLGQQIRSMASKHRVKILSFVREEVRLQLLGSPEGTKWQVAQFIAERFPEELGHRLPPKRQPWMSEDHRMGIFEAVALVMVFWVRRMNQANKRDEVAELN